MYVSEEYEDETEDTTTNEYNSGDPREEPSAVMKNFFDTQNYIKKKIAYWQGFTLNPFTGKYTRTHEPVAPDSFIYSLIGILDSVVNQHNSVSFTKKENAQKILFESMLAFNQSVLDEPLFNDDRYLMLAEEFDHILELFMGLIIEGHGKGVATALQAGVISENMPKEEKKIGVLDRTRELLDRRV